MSDAETLRQAAASLRADFSDAAADPFENGVADLLDVTAEHIESHDCEAHCEPDGCASVKHALVLARAWLGEVNGVSGRCPKHALTFCVECGWV